MPFSPTDLPGLTLWLKADAGVLDGSNNPCTNGVGVATWQDQSGNSNDATQPSVSFQPLFTTGAINGLPALRFDGASTFLSYALAVAAAGDFSVFIVLQTTDYSLTQVSLLAGNPSSASDGFGVAIVSLKRGPFLQGVADLFDTTATNGPEIWSALGTQGGPYTFWVGSTPRPLTPNTGTMGLPSAGGLIGANPGPTLPWSGPIGEIIIYDNVLGSTDLQSVQSYLLGRWQTPYPTAVLADSPVAYYRMGEPPQTISSGVTVLEDSSTSDYDGVYDATNTTLGISGALLGDPNTAATSGGGLGSAAVAQNNVGLLDYPSGRSTVSLEAWINFTTITNGDVIGWDGGGAGGSFQMFTVTDGTVWAGYSLTSSGTNFLEVVSTTPINDGNWHHVVVVFTGTDVILYIDGVQNATSSPFTADTITASAGTFYILEVDIDVTSVDEVAVYPTALSSGRVLAHYNAGRSFTADSTGTAAGSSTASGVSDQATDSTGTALGVASASGVGGSLTDSVGTANGLATANGVSASTTDSVGTANGLATANGVGNSTTDSVGTANGNSTALGVGAGGLTPTGSGGFRQFWGCVDG